MVVEMGRKVEVERVIVGVVKVVEGLVYLPIMRRIRRVKR
jgi:hypothetical protein